MHVASQVRVENTVGPFNNIQNTVFALIRRLLQATHPPTHPPAAATAAAAAPLPPEGVRAHACAGERAHMRACARACWPCWGSIGFVPD